MSKNPNLSKLLIQEKEISVIKTKQQCTDCNGYGMVKTDVEICEGCNGKKCMRCNSTGLSVMPYSDCIRCDRTGEIWG
jgi:hypothetical protein